MGAPLTESPASAESIAPHPGRVLQEAYLDPLSLTGDELADGLKIPRPRLNEILRGERSIKADTALRLSRYLGGTAELWISLQARHDLSKARALKYADICREIRPLKGKEEG